METRDDAKALGARCDECPLRVGGRFVPTVGPGDASLVFVGEAPGANEARLGKPFVGPSGQLLDRVMSYHKLDRKEAKLTNAALCRPADGSTPPESAFRACRPRLKKELEGADTVVAMGNWAAHSILNRTGKAAGILALRVGSGRTVADLPGVRIIPTVHPAACLRQGDMFPSLVTDIGKVGGLSEPWHEPKWIVVDNRLDALQALRELAAREGPLAVDIEVDIDKDTSFEHASRHSMLSIGIAYARDKAVVFGETVCGDGDVLRTMGEVLRAKRIIGQNFKFDAKGLYGVMGPVPVWFDTMLASYVLDERPGIHGLKTQAVEKLGAPQYDAEIKRYVGPSDGYGVIPRPVLYKYNAYDATCTYALHELQSKRLDAADLRKVHDFLVEASNELLFVELNGLTVDLDYNGELIESYLESLAPLEKRLDDIVKRATNGLVTGINPRSPKQVQEFFRTQNVIVDSTNEETLKLLAARFDPESDMGQFLSTLLVHRREAKLYGTYVKGIRKRLYRGRVYPTFLLHGTTTGRLSCRNPNLQNIPRESAMRRQFVPAQRGNVFVQADYAQAELRVLSYLAGDTYFRDIFRAGDIDVFDDLSTILYPGIAPPQKGFSSEIEFAAWKELRIRVKAFVYGLAYGRTYFTVAQEFKLPVQEARRLQENFFDVIPEIVQFQKETKQRVLDGKDLITPFGRHRRFWLITDDNRQTTFNEALAFLPQSTASDICLRAMVRVRRELRGTGCFVRNIVHDSILVDGPEDKEDLMRYVLAHNMLESAEEVVGDFVPFKVDIKVGQNWGEV